MTNRNPDVDAWFATYENPQKDLVQAVRNVMLAADSRLGEVIKWKAPTFVYKGNVASFFPRATRHVTLMFHTGASLPDPQGIFSGEGETGRSVQIADRADLDAKSEALQGLVRAWIAARDGSN
ncbi:hypothetical protein N802_09405 [Knoellia sinensis KCTC 19936]|uniref:YdhG-like domain-containing protein n=1 Tax=Knoellia sinensis KCTC 19936 TaxID=1385520 RepID=A0A0A0J3W7_9MICO|nr:DUF1801 domain-containing protein [Knoellia sinensis]KGN30331.1 hypothetical protein N802_09405 [Knoellia sinensis KCTC 19936]